MKYPVKSLLLRQLHGRCGYCGVVLSGQWGQGFNGENSLTAAVIDHKVPKAHGGTDAPENLMLCCVSCNSSKGAKTVEQFRLFRSRQASEAPYFTPAQTEWLVGKGFDPNHLGMGARQRITFYFERASLTLLDRERDKSRVARAASA